jgi:phosphoserine phosphatase
MLAALVSLTMLAATPQLASESLPEPILAEIRAARSTLPPGTRAVVVFDFDGTLLNGDITEGGPASGGRGVFPGMVELGIAAGLSATHPPGSFRTWESEYRRLESEQGGDVAYRLPLTAFTGAGENRLAELARRHFGAELRPRLFATTTRILKTLETEGYECHVISASAEVYVAAAAEELGLSRDRFHGVRARLDAQGRILPEIVQFPYREGKSTVIGRLITGRDARLLAVLGNSWDTDGAMLELAARQRLEGRGGAGSWIFNAGTAPAWARGLGIREGTLTSVVGEAAR